MAVADYMRNGHTPSSNYGKSEKKLLKVMRESDFFSGLNDRELEKVASTVVIGRYRPHQVIFVEGDVNRILYFILSGRVKVYRQSIDGRERIINMLGAGEPMAAVPFCDGGGYPANAEIIEEAEIALLRWEDFQMIAKDNPEILFSVIELMAKRLRRAQGDMHSLALKSVASRLARCILDLSQSYGEETDIGVEIDLKLNRRELGALIGASRETTTRMLRQFEKERVITSHGSKITIIKPLVLRSWSEV